MKKEHKRFPRVTGLFAAVALLWPQTQEDQHLFPLPTMQVEWPSSGLTSRDYGLLAHGVNSAFVDCKPDASDFRFEYALANLGKLGNGVLVRAQERCQCGRGNCQIHVYIRDSDVYREVPFEKHREPWGWAWGVVKSGFDVPDLAFGSNGGGGCQALGLYRYTKGTFVLYAAEHVRLQEGKRAASPEDWWNPSVVVALPSC